MIHRLSQSLVNQIAAGEVIVRPASVVKELVENALDAGATRIRISVSNQNRDISVQDDGRGIPIAEAATALERHTTSKIERPADLTAIMTRGFRGEALASIAAVSKLELRTRTADELVGARVVVWGGDLHNQGQVGCPPGTLIEVRELFFNTPARLKFMKTKASEWGHIAGITTQQALSSHSVGFYLENEGRVVFDLPPNQPARERFLQLCRLQTADDLVEVDYERAGVKVAGLVGVPSVARKDRRHQYFLINGRPVSNRTLSYSLQEAFRGLLMVQRFPICLLFIDVDPKEVDVNVHPTKDEVRFEDERKVAGLLNRAVTAALEKTDLKPSFDLKAVAGARDQDESSPQADLPGVERTRPDYQQAFTKAAHDLYFKRELSNQQSPPPEHQPPAQEQKSPAPPRDTVQNLNVEDKAGAENGSLQPPEDMAQLSGLPEPIGQLAETYIVAQAGEELLLVDQHAAHERLLFMKLLATKSGGAHIQPLLLPFHLQLSATDLPAMEELAPALQEMGFDIQPFGGNDFVVNALPADLADVDAEALVRDLLDDMAEKGATEEVRELRERVAARMACHAAIRAGQTLQQEEMKQLIADLYYTPTTYTCPHGRPTIIRITKDDLDKQFGRKG